MKYSYSAIRQVSPIKSRWRNLFIAEIFCMLLSPFFSIMFLRLKWRPNTITMMMILSGIIGAIFFCCPPTWCKGLGLVFFYLWYIFDCSDGEVARISKQFSKYGKEMDCMAHLICHPLFVLAIWMSYKQMNMYSMDVISIICLGLISVELVGRALIEFEMYLFQQPLISNDSNPKTNFIKYILKQPLYFPNFVLLFPFVLLSDILFGFPSVYVLIVWTVYYTLYFILRLKNFLVLFYKS